MILKLVRVNESNDGTPGNTSNGTLIIFNSMNFINTFLQKYKQYYVKRIMM